MKESEIITYVGENNELFVKKTVDKSLGDSACLIVPETHNAILVKDGKLMDTLESGKYPIYDGKKGLFSDKRGVSTLDIVFMSKTAKLNMLWGTKNQLEYIDPENKIPVKIGANGEIEIQIGNPRKFFLELVGCDFTFTLEDLKTRLLAKLMNEFEPALIEQIRKNNFSIETLSQNKKLISENIEPVISEFLFDEYGIKVFSFTIVRIFIPEETRNTIKEIKEKEDFLECSECKAKNPIDAKFCGNCGKELKPKTKICKFCQKENDGAFKFCVECGKEL